MNPVPYLSQSPRLLDQVSEVLRYRHYSLQHRAGLSVLCEAFLRRSGRAGTMRHPREMGAAEVTQFRAVLANERRVSVPTQKQALSSLLFLYRDVLGVDLA